MAKSRSFGTVDESKARDAGTFTADRRLYLDADGNVVEHDDPNKASLLVAKGGTLPMKRARELGLLDGGEGRVMSSTAADEGDTSKGDESPKDSPKDAPKAEPVKSNEPADKPKGK